MKSSSIYLGLLILCLIGCAESISGNSEEAFKESRLKVEKSLTPTEQQTLEKAFRVVGLYAMSEKWYNAETYADTSINEITLEVVNSKTYNDLVDFAEDYLKKENTYKIEEIEKSIADLKMKINKAKALITPLESFKASEIKIVEGSWDTPDIQVKIINTGKLTNITKYMFLLEIYSISLDKKIDAVGVGGGSDEGIENGEQQFFTYISRSLSSIIERSKILEKQLQDPQYPITDLEKYDLRVQVIPNKIVLKNGKEYHYPKKTPSHFQTEITALENELKHLKSIEGNLAELELEELSSKKEVLYNQDYLVQLAAIRKKHTKIEESLKRIKENVVLCFPVNYEVKKEKARMYYFSVSDSLSFDSEDKNLIQYQIKDTTYTVYEHDYDKTNGTLNVLTKENTKYNIQETISELKSTKYYDLVDADETGYIYVRGGRFKLIRYFKLNQTHYLYEMDYKNLEECVLEFDRSKGILK